MDEIEKINSELDDILGTRLFSTKKQSVQMIERILDKYGLVYDFSDLGDDQELFYTIEDVDGEPLYFHLVFEVDPYTTHVSALAQVLEEEDMNAVLDSYDDFPEGDLGSMGIDPMIGRAQRADYWTTTPYLRQTRRTEDDGGD